MGVRAGTLECGEGARGGGMEERRESGLEPWIVGSVLGKRGGWRIGIYRTGILDCAQFCRHILRVISTLSTL